MVKPLSSEAFGDPRACWYGRKVGVAAAPGNFKVRSFEPYAVFCKAENILKLPAVLLTCVSAWCVFVVEDGQERR